MRVEAGDVFQYSASELAYLVKTAYYERGYLDTEVIPHEQVHGDSIDVTFRVFEGEPWRIRRIDFAGNVKTREKVMRRELAMRPGDIFKSSQLEESQRRLYMLGFFDDVEVRDQASVAGDEKQIDLTFNVAERRTGAASMGAGYSDTYKLVGNIGLQVPNFRGLGQSLDFNWEFGTRRKQFLVGFTEPWLFDTPTSSSVQISNLTMEYRESYDYHRNQVRVRLGRRLKKPAFASVTLGYQLYTQRYSDFAAEIDSLSGLARFQPQTTSSVDVVFRRDTRDLPDFPTTGSVISYTPELASSLIAGDVDFHRHKLTANIYRPTFWRFVLALETKFALIDGFSLLGRPEHLQLGQVQPRRRRPVGRPGARLSRPLPRPALRRPLDDDPEPGVPLSHHRAPGRGPRLRRRRQRLVRPLRLQPPRPAALRRRRLPRPHPHARHDRLRLRLRLRPPQGRRPQAGREHSLPVRSALLLSRPAHPRLSQTE